MRRPLLTIALTLAGVVLAISTPAVATTLEDAIAQAMKRNPGLQQVTAEQDAAMARVAEARAGLGPSVTVSASAGTGRSDLGGFFGFGDRDVSPRTAALTVEQPLDLFGAARARVDQARAGQSAARMRTIAAQLALSVEVADAFERVRRSDAVLVLQMRTRDEIALIADQAKRRFTAGEIARTDADQADARLAESDMALASARSEAMQARARYQAVVGSAPLDLEAPGPGPWSSMTVDEAADRAEAVSPSVSAAAAGVAAARAAVRITQTEGAPTIAAVGEVSSSRDVFLPGYRADGATIGVRGRWALFDGGRGSAHVSEALAALRSAEAGLDRAEREAREAAVDAWHDLKAAEVTTVSSRARSTAARSALESVRQEVRVGQKPTLDLLDAEREALAAQVGELGAVSALVVSRYRLNAVVSGGVAQEKNGPSR